jgi:hypothetical protein
MFHNHLDIAGNGPWFCGGCHFVLDSGLELIDADNKLQHSWKRSVTLATLQASQNRGCRVCKAIYSIIYVSVTKGDNFPHPEQFRCHGTAEWTNKKFILSGYVAMGNRGPRRFYDFDIEIFKHMLPKVG